MPIVQCSVFFSLEEMLPAYNAMLDLKRGNERFSQSDYNGKEEKGKGCTSLQNGRWQEDR